MKLTEAMKIALQALWGNKLRSALTLLGVVIAVASIIMVVTLINGAKTYVTTRINTYGADVVTVSKMPQTVMTVEEFLEFQKRRNITMDDFRAIQDRCTMCLSVGARRSTTGTVIYGKNSVTDANVRGMTWTIPAMSNMDIAIGRSFTEVEDMHRARVAIVGSDIANNLLGPGDPLDKVVRVDGIPYRVIGVGKPQGKMLGQSLDNWVAIPLNCFLQTYGQHDSLEIYAKAGGGSAVVEAVSDQLRTIMRTQRHLRPEQADTFTIGTSSTFLNLLGRILNIFGAVVVAIASISLVVGGIVIMNIMLVSVVERTREIGIRKAMGARRQDILSQFIIESSILALIGGVIGVIVGIGAAKAITLIIAFPSTVAIWSVAVGMILALSVGVFFGVYPAHKAAQLDPIVALRAEL